MNTSLHKGFTLVETLVALTILIISVTGALVSVQNGLFATSLAKDNVTAYYLATEAIEQIRNMRDQNGIEGQNWLTGIAQNISDPCGQSGVSCIVDGINSKLYSCGGGWGTCEHLLQAPSSDQLSNAYGYTSGWQPSKFDREVQITKLNSHEVAVEVRITWNKGLLQQTFDVRENLFDWE